MTIHYSVSLRNINIFSLNQSTTYLGIPFFLRFSHWLSDRGVVFILWIPLTLKMRTHHFSFHPSPFLLDGVTSKPFDGVHSFGKSPKHFPFNQKNYWIGTLPQNRPHTCGVIIHKAAATMAASVATKLYLMKPCGKLLELGWFGLQEFLYISLITWWHFSVSFIFVIWVFPLHFTTVKKIT